MFDDLSGELDNVLDSPEDDIEIGNENLEPLNQEEWMQDDDEPQKLAEQLQNEGFEVNLDGKEEDDIDPNPDADDVVPNTGNKKHSEISFLGECSCGGNCYMVCQNSCASACLSEYSH